MLKSLGLNLCLECSQNIKNIEASKTPLKIPSVKPRKSANHNIIFNGIELIGN